MQTQNDEWFDILSENFTHLSEKLNFLHSEINTKKR